MSDLTELPFKIYTLKEWKRGFEKACLSDVTIEEHRNVVGLSDFPRIIREIGGFGKFLKLMLLFLKYYPLSAVIRDRFRKLNWVKRVLLGYPLIPSRTSRHICYVFCVGEKRVF
jgi:hypothetical protein